MTKLSKSLRSQAQMRLFNLTSECIAFNKPISADSVYFLPQVIDEQITEILENASDPVDQAAYLLIESNWEDWICDLENQITSAIDKA